MIRVFFAATLLLISFEMQAYAQSSSFRVDTDIDIGEQSRPVKQTTTLFSNGVCYDFALDDSQSITVFYPERGLVVLLDCATQSKMVHKMEVLGNAVSKARQEAMHGELAKLVAASSRVHVDDTKGTVAIGDRNLGYEATVQRPPRPDMAAQFSQFADWSARLNSVNPPYFPPYMRLELNRRLAEKGLLPAQIKRYTTHDGRVSLVNCRLHTTWALSADDQRKIERVEQMISSFKELSAAEFNARTKPPVTAHKGAQ